jgi:uncharacterized protein
LTKSVPRPRGRGARTAPGHCRAQFLVVDYLARTFHIAINELRREAAIRLPEAFKRLRLAVTTMIDFLPSSSMASAAGVGVFKLILVFFLVLILIGLGVLGLILRGLLSLLFGRRNETGDGQGTDGRFRFGRAPSPDKLPERMLACGLCGVHVPESEGVRTADGFFCCEEHRRAHDKNKAEAVGP